MKNSIKTFADACIKTGTTEEEFYAKCKRKRLNKTKIACKKLRIISKALGTNINYSNIKAKKYLPYFSCSPTFKLEDTCFSSGAVEAETVFYSSANAAKYVAKHFEPLYKRLLGL